MLQGHDDIFIAQESDAPGGLADYYHNRHVRARILEVVGDASVYIIASDAAHDHHFEPLRIRELDRCLDEQKEISRSLWDRKHLVAHLDIEYANFDDPDRPYQQFEECYE